MNPNVPSLSAADYRYILPDDRIPDRPLTTREQSKLLFYQRGTVSDHSFSQLPSLLPKESFLVFNNSKVIPARVYFSSPTGASIEILCLHPTGNEKQDEGMRSQAWKCIVGNLKRWKPDVSLQWTHEPLFLSAELKEKGGEENTILFSWPNEFTFFDILEKAGEMPLPPYMHRQADDSDKTRYQTVYAAEPGSIAAPTAGLHFTAKVLKELQHQKIGSAQVTLHVGAGTFKPIKTEKVADHSMHEEFFEVNKKLLHNLLSNDFIIPVGTTSLRTIESLYHLGCQILEENDQLYVPQWAGFEKRETSKKEAIEALLHLMEQKETDKLIGSTSIMIAPGYTFRMAKGLITNFHQPESTLILLVAAFLGPDWKRVYDYALENDFRFLSYGDSSLLLPS